MSHSTVVVFFIVLVGIYITHGQVFCRDKTGICMNSLANPPFPKCSPIEPDCPECPKINKKGKTTQPCCIDCQQDFINVRCNDIAEGSVGQYYNNQTRCCPAMYELAQPFKDSPCRCCQFCLRTKRCVKFSGYCVTEDDPTRSVASCIAKGWSINEKWCKGDGCSCCYRKRK